MLKTNLQRHSKKLKTKKNKKKKQVRYTKVTYTFEYFQKIAVCYEKLFCRLKKSEKITIEIFLTLPSIARRK